MRKTKNPVSLLFKKGWSPDVKPPTPAQQRRSQLLHQYGLTVEHYEAMFNDQWQSCAICFQRQKNQRRLHVDHDHHSKKVRGLLCTRCNTALGGFRHSIKYLMSAIEY